MDFLYVLSIIGQWIAGLYFAMSGFMHFINLDMLAKYAQSKRVPLPGFATVVTGLMLLFGSATILLGVHQTAGILVLAVFLLGTSIMMHRFWSETGDARMAEMTHFLKNMALLGLLLMLL